ncbi:sedoheptulokinase [Paenibacillus endophyticus]|uniref:Sedoheptulokinase n=1 Tax=Paenibacillus endophyticus TaxID=1294268 RepID=A0A7W5C3L7_9BACL|nr:FGGY family carbohydrate kinase [Paenibacillus endophyticus]MBB3150601.1 sedoheptulokinase [Paenibacillus endophyticus]
MSDSATVKLAAGIDIGTTSISIILSSIETGETVKLVTTMNTTVISSKRNWEKQQNPDQIAAMVVNLIQDCSEVWQQVAAIGISNQMHGVLYIDRSGNAVSPLYTWQDGRGDLPMTASVTYAESLGEFWGQPIATGYGLVTHYFNVLNDGLSADCYKLCTIGDYVAMKLCGLNEPIMDATHAAAIGFFSAETHSFEFDRLESAALDATILPELAGKDGLVGYTPDGKPVICAIGDNQASFLGSVPRLSDSVLLNIGTGAQISAYSDRWLKADGLETRPFPGGGYLLVGASLSGGKSYALLKSFFQETVRAFGTLAEDELYSEMNRLAEAALDSGVPPLRFDTRFYGTRIDPAAAGGINGLLASNFTPGHFAAGILNGVADELMDFIQLAPPQLSSVWTNAVGSGNGIRKNGVMQRLLRERLSLPLRLSGAAEEAAFGAAIYSAARANLFTDLDAAIAVMHRGECQDV